MLIPVVEAHTVDVVDEGLGRHALRQEERMVRQFNVVLNKRGRHVLFLHD